MFFKKKIIISVSIILFIVVLLTVSHFFPIKKNNEQIYGVSFNSEYASYLGLNSREVYKAILNDWGFRYLRLSAQWDEIEKQKGVYDFSDLDWYMDEAAVVDGKVTLVVGQKILRWPECHAPKWTENLSDDEYRASVKNLIKATIERYKNHKALEIWQIENEPFLAFGVCRKCSPEMLDEEISLARSIDLNHKIIVTDSGELSTWLKTSNVADYFGTTMYRVVWNEKIGYFNYKWLSPLFYHFRLWVNKKSADTVFISELQAEPWIPDHNIQTLSLDEQYKSMSIEHFKDNVDYAKRVGFPRAYLWGAEWWYWMQNNKGVDDFAEYAKTLKKE